MSTTDIPRELLLPSGETIQYEAPKHFHIPKVLAEGGIKNYEVHAIAATLAMLETRRGAFFDVGANIGLFSWCVAGVLRRRCLAYEPFPDAAGVLRQVRDRYSWPIDVNQKAVGREPGSQRFYLSAKSDMSNSLNPSFRQHRGELDVQVTTLDAELMVEAPALIKIDTETTEEAVVAGGLKMITVYRPPIIIELLTDAIAQNVMKMLAPLGYRSYRIGEGICFPEVSDISTSHDGDARNWLLSPSGLDQTFSDALNKWRGVIFSI